MPTTHTAPPSGFTLLEMAIVLAIVGLLLSGGMMTFTALQEQRRHKETRLLLDEARDALLGFAVTYGRLPCPASDLSNGVESPVGGGACTNPFDGFLPAVTLGLPGVAADGSLPDAWGLSQNRLRYAVTIANAAAHDATTTNGIQSRTMAAFTPDLQVCDSATGITATSCGTATTLTGNAIAVIYSLGKNAATGGSGADEAANLNNDTVFVSHTPTHQGSAGGEFDDLVSWLAPSILYNRMIQAGKLP